MCPLCEQVEKIVKENDSAFIHEFKNSYFVLGGHQYYQGYSMLVLKSHVTNLLELSAVEQKEFFEEVMIAAKCISEVFNPSRINYASLGNIVEHVHFHLIPRYEEELAEATEKDPWHNSKDFNTKKISKEDELELAARIKRTLDKMNNGK